MENVNNLKTLTRQTKTVRCVINFPCKGKLYNLSAYNIPKFCDDLSSSSLLYALILHDKDIDENGELKTVHLHLFLMSGKRHQLKYYVYLLSDLLGVSEELISVRVSNSDAGDIQYLIHKNDLNKYQYDPKEIRTNINKDMFDSLMAQNIVSDISSKELIELCRNHNKLELIEILGPYRFNQLSRVVNEIYKELRIERVRNHIYNDIKTNNSNIQN